MADLSLVHSFGVVLPIVHAGWLDLGGWAKGRGRAAYEVGLVPPGASSATSATGNLLAAQHNRVYLPAGWSVIVSMRGEFSVESNASDNGLSSGSLSLSFSGRVTLAGAAVNAAHGKRFARRSVALPAAVSCSGSAAVRLTRYARKKAKSVTFLVNGHRVRTVKRIKRARTLGIRVPTSGPITISAKVTPKHGKKARVTRSYAACR
jgi:hypothetical protein